ncbi:hypothetical protein [Parvularcula dongshanensis]|uniref:Uncharacterized protein n=1 Tax=Parvularcula dongshanensis TaxID=1173995 RepID=A0A840I614_9PROT|nr:hypothetical protein [Parvularcula dongshanensis]MBB4659624.1 hypothetical protein [Parvularcula dongshanensis]
MISLLDAALLCLSLFTAIYCAVLSRRLRRLHDLKHGLGAAVVAMTKAAGSVRQETTTLTAKTAGAAERLERLLGRIDACEPKVDLLLETMDRQARETWRENRARIEATRTEVTLLAADMRVLIELMNEQVLKNAQDDEPERQARTRSARSAPVPAGSPVPSRAAPADNVVRVAPAAPSRPNPFARRAAGGE